MLFTVALNNFTPCELNLVQSLLSALAELAFCLQLSLPGNPLMQRRVAFLNKRATELLMVLDYQLVLGLPFFLALLVMKAASLRCSFDAFL
jgi:hypothetical protein